MTDKPTITQAEDLADAICGCSNRDQHRRDVALIEAFRADAVAELQAEVERMQSTLRDICIHSNSDWAQVSSNPAAAIGKIHAIAINAYYSKDGLAQKEPVE